MKNSPKTISCNALSRRCAGLSFIEVMLSLAITGMIGASVVSMVSAVQYGTTNEADRRRLNIKQEIIRSRVNAAIRSSRMVLDSGSDYLVLWMGDTSANDKPNLSELRRVEWDSQTNELWSNKAPDTLAESDDTEFELTDDFDTITSALAGTANFPDELWATELTAWTHSLNETDAQTATVVIYSTTVQGADLSVSASSTSFLRSN